MEPSATTRNLGAPLPRVSWAERLGWGHHGFRANRRAARLLLLAFLALPFLHDMQMAYRKGFVDAYVDYRIFHTAATTFAADPTGNIYAARQNYLYPPFFLTLFVELLRFEPNVGVMIFQCVKWIALYIALTCAWRLCAPREEDAPPIVALGSLILCWRYFTNDMLNGNINVLMLGLVLGGVSLVRSGRHTWGGFVIAVAACLKVTPALILVYFAYKGWWRALIGAAAGMSVCLLFWPALVIGWDANLRLLEQWFWTVPAGYLAQGWVYAYGTNQGLAAVLSRYLEDTVAVSPNIQITVWSLPHNVVNSLRIVLSLAVLFCAWRAVRGRSMERQPALAYGAEIAVLQIVMLILSGYTWKAHYVAMLLPYAVLLAYLADARLAAGPKPLIAACIVISFLLMTLSADIFGPHAADMALAYGVVLGSAVVAGVGLLLARAALRRMQVI